MNTKQLKQIEFDITHNAPESRLARAEEFGPVLRQDLSRLREKAVGVFAQFRATVEAETGCAYSGPARPVAIEQDMRHARLAKVVAWVLTVAELVMAFFLSLLFLLNPFFALMLAVIAIVALKAGLLAAWRNDAQPLRTRQKLRRWVIGPSLLLTLGSAAALIFTRGVLGWLALLLLPLVNLWMCAFSLGLLGLAAGLYAMGFLLSWSRHLERQFNAIEREAVEARKVLQKVEKVIEEFHPSRQAVPRAVPSSTQQPRIASTSVKNRDAIGKVLSLFLLAAVSLSGCDVNDRQKQGIGMADGSAASAESGAARDEGARIEIWLDWSLSAEEAIYRETLQKLLTVLPSVAAGGRITRIAAYRFAENGWNAPEILSVALPSRDVSERSEAGAVFGQIQQAQQKQDEEQYQARLSQALAEVTAEKLLPGQIAEPRCTDLRGVFHRIAESSGRERRLVFLFTDGHETCSSGLKPVQIVKSNATVIAVILPEVPRNGEAMRPDEVWQERRAAIEAAMPGIRVIPHFADLNAIASEAISR